MPSHWGHKKLNIATASSPTGTQFLNGVGAAEAGLRYQAIERLRDRTDMFKDDEVVLVTSGDGTTSQGEFWEAINTAANLKLPVIFLIEDNKYAISVPIEVQTAGNSISKCMSGIPGLFIEEVDGCDPIASYDVMLRAAQYCRDRKGPALVHAHVIRPYSHSLSDDERLYRSEKEREDDAQRDPVTAFAQFLIDEGILTEKALEELREGVDAEIQDAADRALEQPQPAPETAMDYVYSPDVDPTSDEFASDPEFGEGNPTTMVDLLNVCLKDEMERDPAIVVFGQDVADASREDALDEVKGKGGVFKVTWGLQKKFGSARVYNSPLAEANIVGNEYKCPMVVRVTYGGYLKGGAIYHSQTGASIFTHTPGMRVVCPATAEDANGLLTQAPLPADLQQGQVSRPRLHDPVRHGKRGARGIRCHGGDLRCDGRALAASSESPCRGVRHRDRGHRPPHLEPLRYGYNRRVGEKDQQGVDRLRRSGVMGLRSGDRSQGRRRPVRMARWTGPPRRRSGHIRRLRAATRGRNLASG
jgi:2-oxoisovalerate dehydrogenase E1 component